MLSNRTKYKKQLKVNLQVKYLVKLLKLQETN